MVRQNLIDKIRNFRKINQKRHSVSNADMIMYREDAQQKVNSASSVEGTIILPSYAYKEEIPVLDKTLADGIKLDK